MMPEDIALLDDFFETHTYDNEEDWHEHPASSTEYDLHILGGAGSGNFGHAGRPGKVGGSAEREMYGRPPKADGHGREYFDNLGKMGWYEDSFGWDDMEEKKKKWKLKVAMELDAEIARQTGKPGYAISSEKMVKQWAKSSNDEDLRSLSIQEAASEEFGVEMSDWQKKSLAEQKSRRADKIQGLGYNNFMQPGWQRPNLMTNEEFAFGQWKEDAGNTLTRTALRAMYDKTQAELKAAGIKELTVFRGIYCML